MREEVRYVEGEGTKGSIHKKLTRQVHTNKF